MGLLDTFCIDLVDPVDACRLGWAVGETNCDGCCVVLASRVHVSCMYGEAVGLLRQRQAMSVLLSSGSFFFSRFFSPRRASFNSRCEGV